jgi:hypothetical protein
MGDIADAMLDGDLCQGCGVYMEGGNGYPQTCPSCQREAKDFPQGRSAKVKCPICNKTVKAVGLKDHTRDAHSAHDRGTKP